MPELNQQQFDLPGYKEQEGVTVAQFMRRATWHGTSRPDWNTEIKHANQSVHHGTPQAAADRAFIRPESPSAVRQTQVYPVLANEVSDMPPISDPAANQMGEARNRGLKSDVIDKSFGDEVISGLAEMEHGRTVPYVNEAEDRGATSFVSPPGGFKTLDETTNFQELPRAQAFVEGRDFAQVGAQLRADPGRRNRLFASGLTYKGEHTSDDVGEEEFL